MLSRLFLPDFTWPNPLPPTITDQVPETPRPLRPHVRRLFGIFHKFLQNFSVYYCRWFGISYNNQVAQLPFGLVLKWSDGTRLEEVLAMQVARKAGFPVPKVISYGDHPDCAHAPMSILMTRIPGREFGQVYETLTQAERDNILQQLKGYLEAMRRWKNPWHESRICSVVGTSVRSIRVPNHYAGPFDSEEEFNAYLIGPASAHGFSTKEAFEDTLRRAKKKEKMNHPIVFTHGDLKNHNILVHNGQISGFIDWESAGWYPDYWEFTTAMRFIPLDFWWYEFAIGLGGGQYLTELDCDRALNNLTVDSYAW